VALRRASNASHIFTSLQDYQSTLFGRPLTHLDTMMRHSSQPHPDSQAPNESTIVLSVSSFNVSHNLNSEPHMPAENPLEDSKDEAALPCAGQPSVSYSSDRTAPESAEKQAPLESPQAKNPEQMTKPLWLSPHVMEHQKRIWYYSSLGMGEKHVQDEWGFSSANVSRSHSPSVGKAV